MRKRALMGSESARAPERCQARSRSLRGKRPLTAERATPLPSDEVEPLLRGLHGCRIELPYPLATEAPAPQHARRGEHLEVLAHRLPRHADAFGQPRRGERATRTEPAHETQPGVV